MDKGAQDRSSAIDRELQELRELGNEIVSRAKVGGASVAECMLRTGGELSVRVRMGKVELVEEAGTRAAGLRLMKGKRVATTSTSDLTPSGVDRFIKDALELCEISQEDPFAGPVDPSLLGDASKAPDLDLYDPAGGAPRRPPGGPGDCQGAEGGKGTIDASRPLHLARGHRASARWR